MCVCVLSFLAYSRPFAYAHLYMFVPICICVPLLNESLDKCYSAHILKKKKQRKIVIIIKLPVRLWHLAISVLLAVVVLALFVYALIWRSLRPALFPF